MSLADRQIAALGGQGILNYDDLPSLSEAATRVERLMLDGRWHEATEIIYVSGQREGLRRMRELRNRYTIERRRDEGLRDFSYRLVRR